MALLAEIEPQQARIPLTARRIFAHLHGGADTKEAERFHRMAILVARAVRLAQRVGGGEFQQCLAPLAGLRLGLFFSGSCGNRCGEHAEERRKGDQGAAHGESPVTRLSMPGR